MVEPIHAPPPAPSPALSPAPSPAHPPHLALVPMPAPEPGSGPEPEPEVQSEPNLRLLTVYELWDTPTLQHHVAAEERAHAFHEAAHVWVADRAGLAPQSASATEDGPRFIAPDDKTTMWIAAAGFFAQGLVLEADDYRHDEQMPADETLNLIELEEFIKPGVVTECIAAMIEDGCCRRGGDHRVIDLLEDERWVASHLESMLAGWHYIDSLAYALLTNDRLDRAAINRALS